MGHDFPAEGGRWGFDATVAALAYWQGGWTELVASGPTLVGQGQATLAVE